MTTAENIGRSSPLRDAKKAWHGVKLNQPDWGDASYCIAFGGELRRDGMLFHFILNGFWEPLDFELPTLAASATMETLHAA